MDVAAGRFALGAERGTCRGCRVLDDVVEERGCRTCVTDRLRDLSPELLDVGCAARVEPVQRQHGVEGVDDEQPRPSFGDLCGDVGECAAGEAVIRLVEGEVLGDQVVTNTKRSEPCQDLALPHGVEVGPGDGVAGLELRFREDQRKPGLE
jgi:hypothetical protein